MLIEEDPALRAAALDLLRSEYGMAEQRPGLHQSQLSYCLTKAYRDIREPIPPTDTEVKLFAIGFGLERVLLASEQSPAEIVVDGISCSLDTISLFGPSDLKSTRMRAAGRKGEGGFQIPQGWIRQFMAYRYALNYKYGYAIEEPSGKIYDEYLQFNVIIIHLIEPELSAYRLHFTAEELEENWSWLLTRASQLESMLAANDPMPFLFAEPWECKSCRYNLMCSLEASVAAPSEPQMLFPFSNE